MWGSGAVMRRKLQDEEARLLGGKFSSVEEFVKDRLPESQQKSARRRKKEWNPNKRVPDPRDERRARKREERRVNPAQSPAELLELFVGHPFQVSRREGEERYDILQQGALACRADTGDLVERVLDHLLLAPRPV